MPLLPISRDSMRARRAQTLEKERMNQVERIVSQIYSGALQTAGQTSDSRHLYLLPAVRTMHHIDENLYPNGGVAPPEFHRANMADILGGVQSLFPDCSVEHTTLTMARTPDGKMCDISKIDENLKPFLRVVEPSKEYIVVDWS